MQCHTRRPALLLPSACDGVPRPAVRCSRAMACDAEALRAANTILQAKKNIVDNTSMYYGWLPSPFDWETCSYSDIN